MRNLVRIRCSCHTVFRKTVVIVVISKFQKQVTAILEAGRVSLDNDGRKVKIITDADGTPTDLE